MESSLVASEIRLGKYDKSISPEKCNIRQYRKMKCAEEFKYNFWIWMRTSILMRCFLWLSSVLIVSSHLTIKKETKFLIVCHYVMRKSH